MASASCSSTASASASSSRLLTEEEAARMGHLFEALAGTTRLRLLQALSVLDDPCMGDLAASVGMKPQAVSNQLRRLAAMGILGTRRHGSHIHYCIVDAGVAELLRLGLQLFRGSRPAGEGDPA